MKLQHLSEKLAIQSKMAQLSEYKNSIQKIQNAWDNLSLLAQMSGIRTDLTPTRASFSTLSADLIEHIAEEAINKATNQLEAKASVIINLITRNLFERTADIGFLASDDNIRAYLGQYKLGTARAEETTALEDRFSEYVKKYSVYSDVIILDPDGQVLVRLDQSNPIKRTQDAFVAEALTTSAPYVEVYRHSELTKEQDKSLIYAYRVCEKDSNTAIGVLCLVFKLDDELKAMFAQAFKGEDWAVGVMLDSNQRVIASSDPYQIPVNAPLEVSNTDSRWILTKFAGRSYIAVTQKAAGYQGYMGPGWMGHALIPLEHAFDHHAEDQISSIDALLLACVMQNTQLFSESLLNIPKQAIAIQNKLNRSVWNGNIYETKQSDKNQHVFSKTLLKEISDTGLATQVMIEAAVTNLYQTVVLDILENIGFLSYLAVDIMDRNLYERANDCRWWALTDTFKRALSENTEGADNQHRKALTGILKYVNGLYTVYENLVIFDQHGTILAVSNPDYNPYIDQSVNKSLLSALEKTKNSQDYVVSAFEPSALYRDRPTYIYAAAIRAEDNTLLGGIGIVFDSEPQFKAILRDTLPKSPEGHEILGAFSLFVDGNNQIISSSNDTLMPCDHFTPPQPLAELTQGEIGFDITSYQDRYYAVGACVSSGYREYKGRDDCYQNKITALVYVPLGNMAEVNALMRARQSADDKKAQTRAARSSNTPMQDAEMSEFASFYLNEKWLAFPAMNIVEALDSNDIRSLPDSLSHIAGVIKYRDVVIPIVNLSSAMGDIDRQDIEKMQIVVLELAIDGSMLGVLIDSLGDIVSLDPQHIQSVLSIFNKKDIGIATGVAPISMHDKTTKMLTILSADNISAKISFNKS